MMSTKTGDLNRSIAPTTTRILEFGNLKKNWKTHRGITPSAPKNRKKKRKRGIIIIQKTFVQDGQLRIR